MEQQFYGYFMRSETFEEKSTCVVFPKKGTKNSYLAVKTEYWGAFPQAVELSLLEKKAFTFATFKTITVGEPLGILIGRHDLSAMFAAPAVCRKRSCPLV